jgi:hypothetical protein
MSIGRQSNKEGVGLIGVMIGSVCSGFSSLFGTCFVRGQQIFGVGMPVGMVVGTGLCGRIGIGSWGVHLLN